MPGILLYFSETEFLTFPQLQWQLGGAGEAADSAALRTEVYTRCPVCYKGAGI